MINKEFWQGKRVFLTGHTGFKGSWLSLWLSQLGAEVHGYSLKPICEPNLFDTAKVVNKVNNTFGDIRDLKKLSETIQRANPEVIFHMAAQALVRESYHNPVDTYEINVMGTVNLLEAARSCRSLKTIINITTDKVYENKEWAWPYRESDPLGGHDPYSNSKACSELVTSSYISSFFGKDSQVSIVTGRAGNVIGGGDWSTDRLMPDIVRAIQSKSALKIRNPKAIRPWQHVLESLNGYLELAQYLDKKDAKVRSLNFGPGRESFVSVEQILSYVQQRHPLLKIEIESSNLHEAQILKLDNTLANELLGWKSKWSYIETLNKTFDWYERFHSGADALDITLAQIEDFSG